MSDSALVAIPTSHFQSMLLYLINTGMIFPEKFNSDPFLYLSKNFVVSRDYLEKDEYKNLLMVMVYTKFRNRNTNMFDELQITDDVSLFIKDSVAGSHRTTFDGVLKIKMFDGNIIYKKINTLLGFKFEVSKILHWVDYTGDVGMINYQLDEFNINVLSTFRFLSDGLTRYSYIHEYDSNFKNDVIDSVFRAYANGNYPGSSMLRQTFNDMKIYEYTDDETESMIDLIFNR